MKKNIFYVLLFFYMIFISCIIGFADENKYSDVFEGIWCSYIDPWPLDDFIIIKKVEDKFLVFDIGIKDDVVNKNFGEKLNKDTLKIMLWDEIYYLKYSKKDGNEYLEMYLTPYDEEYPVYERIENFSIDKF